MVVQMLKIFRPEFSGTYSPESLRPDFIAALAQRVRGGLFPFASERRNRYVVMSESEKELRFRSEGVLTSISIGLNDVQVEVALGKGSPPQVCYEVTYFGWARYGVILCGAIGIALVACWSLFGERLGARKSGANAIFWVVVIFWGFVWPWILAALHKRPAAKALERLFAEINRAKT